MDLGKQQPEIVPPHLTRTRRFTRAPHRATTPRTDRQTHQQLHRPDLGSGESSSSRPSRHRQPIHRPRPTVFVRDGLNRGMTGAGSHRFVTTRLPPTLLCLSASPRQVRHRALPDLSAACSIPPWLLSAGIPRVANSAPATRGCKKPGRPPRREGALAHPVPRAGRSLRGPARPARDIHGDDRPRRWLLTVMGVAAGQFGERHSCLICAHANNPRCAIGSSPPQLTPIV
jgi:hypothetical protein